MPSLPKRHKSPDPQLIERVRSEVRRILAVLDDAAVSGNLARLGQAFSGDALAELKARFTAYQAAGIQVSPFRESLHLEISGTAPASSPPRPPPAPPTSRSCFGWSLTARGSHGA
jgi:hypothetical protein